MINILITGATGQLGSELKTIYKNNLYNLEESANFVFTNTDTLDLTNTVFVKKYLEDHYFDFIVNCAAYTNVDLAEKHEEKAHLVNSLCLDNIIYSIKGLDTKLIHISTDYVFDGNSNIPYSEDMPTNPQSVYGKSKLDGEKFVSSFENSIIIRTSWLYSSFGRNFAKTINNLCKEKEELKVVFDQVGTPTYAFDLAMAIMHIIKQSVKENRFIPGIYHYSNEGVCSWYDFAKAIASKSNSKCNIIPIESKDFPTLAKRPSYSVLNKSKIKLKYKIKIPHWQDSLDEFFKKI